MKSFLCFLFFVFTATLNTNYGFASELRGGYIQVERSEDQSLTYQVGLVLYTDLGSTVRPGDGMVNFGDGSGLFSFKARDPDYFEDLGNKVGYNIFYILHSFPAPGTYVISYLETNRNGGIANINNSVNVPFYIETEIVIDPLLGNNSSPTVRNHWPRLNETGSNYFFPLILNDIDGDSLTMEETPVLKTHEVPADGYQAPSTEANGIVVSRMHVNRTANDIDWENTETEGEYNYAFRINEWRFEKVTNSWTKMGYVEYDYQQIFADYKASPFRVEGFEDTAILAGNPAKINFTISNPDSQVFRIKLFTDMELIKQTDFNLIDSVDYSSPAVGGITINNTSELIRPKPYKLIISVTGKREQQFSCFLWITGMTGTPGMPAVLGKEIYYKSDI